MSENDDLRYLRVASLVFGQPLLITQEAGETIGAYLGARMDGGDISANRLVGQPQFDEQSGRWKGYHKVGNVGVVPVVGELVNRGAWIGASSGLVSYEGLAEQVRLAGADESVSSILMDFRSPGGEAWGMVDAARTIRMAANGKPLVAIANASMASAAYGLGCVADEIVVNESGLVGSIGTIVVHYDRTEQMRNAGVRATVLKTGKKKAPGIGGTSLSDGDAETLMAHAQRIMDGFAGLVSEFRPKLSVDAIRAMEGEIFIGSDAVEAGLADRVGTFESVLADLTRGERRTPSHVKGNRMSEKTGASAATEDAGITQAQLDQAVSAAKSEGEAKGRDAAKAENKVAIEDAVKAERERVSNLNALNSEGLAPIGAIVAKGIENGADVSSVALEIAKSPEVANARKGASVIAGMQGDDPSASGASPAAPGDDGASEPAATASREHLIAHFNASPKLQQEFPGGAESWAAMIIHDRKKG